MRPFLLMLLAALAACSSSPARQAPEPSRAAPEVTPSHPGGGAPYFEFQVETPARERRDGCKPQLPEELRSPGSRGEAVGQFIVDTTGAPEPQTFKVVRTTHESWASAVRAALPCMRYSPARIRGRPVRQIVQQPFVFDVRR